MVSGLIYTFIALLSTLSAVAAVIFGVYLVSTSLTQAMTGNLERGSLFFLHAVAMGFAAYSLVTFSHYLARRSLILLNAIEDEGEEWEEVDGDGEPEE